MRAINFKKKQDSFKVVHKGDEAVACWKFTIADGLTALAEPTKTDIGNDLWTITIELGIEDEYWWLMRWGTHAEMVMIGAAEVLSWLSTGTAGETRSYKQYSVADGTELKNDTMVDVGEGFYYAEPVIEPSAVIMDDLVYRTLTLPYIVMNVGGGPIGNMQFLNVGLNTVGPLVEKHSYFDQPRGIWVNDSSRTAKASDLAKAVCHKYGKEWSDRSDPDWIGNWIKYIRTYDENAKKFRLYKIITPESNSANFDLHVLDEDNNYYIRGVSILLLQNLETIDGTDGAIFDYREVV